MKIRMYGCGKPIKMMVGGLHGKEWKYTRLLTNKVSEEDQINGTIFIVSRLSKSKKYVSTLKDEFYETDAGKKLLNLFVILKPEIYLEIHAYSLRSLQRLTDPYRKRKYGVPPFYKFNSGLLLGSVSNKLLSRVKVEAAIALEVPMNKEMLDAYTDALKVISIILSSLNPNDFWMKLLSLNDDSSYINYINKIREWIIKYKDN